MRVVVKFQAMDRDSSWEAAKPTVLAALGGGFGKGVPVLVTRSKLEDWVVQELGKIVGRNANLASRPHSERWYSTVPDESEMLVGPLGTSLEASKRRWSFRGKTRIGPIGDDHYVTVNSLLPASDAVSTVSTVKIDAAGLLRSEIEALRTRLVSSEFALREATVRCTSLKAEVDASTRVLSDLRTRAATAESSQREIAARAASLELEWEESGRQLTEVREAAAGAELEMRAATERAQAAGAQLAEVRAERARFGAERDILREQHRELLDAATSPTGRAVSYSWSETPGTPANGILKALRGQLAARQLRQDVAAPLLAAWVTGLMPITDGPRALAGLEALAASVAGGRMAVARVSPTLLDLGDVFGGPRSASEAVMASAFHAARLMPRLALLCLDGINRAPTEAWLVTLLGSREAQPASSRLGPPRLGLEIVRRLEPPLGWPSQLVIGGTLVRGPTTLPLSHDLFGGAIVIQIRSDGRLVGETPPTPTEMALDEWKPSGDSTAFDWKGAPELDGLEVTARRFELGLLQFEPDADVRRRWLVDCLIVPALVAWSALERQSRENVSRRIKAVLPTMTDAEIAPLVLRLAD